MEKIFLFLDKMSSKQRRQGVKILDVISSSRFIIKVVHRHQGERQKCGWLLLYSPLFVSALTIRC
jgi:hypothetical protein